MKYYKASPPVCGEFGPKSQIDYDTFPYTISNVHFLVDRWPDDLITSHPVFMASDALASELLSQGCTGFLTESCVLEKSNQYSSRKNGELPKFVRLVINEENEETDLYVKSFDLLISEKCRSLLRHFNCLNSRFEEFEQNQ